MLPKRRAGGRRQAGDGRRAPAAASPRAPFAKKGRAKGPGAQPPGKCNAHERTSTVPGRFRDVATLPARIVATQRGSRRAAVFWRERGVNRGPRPEREGGEEGQGARRQSEEGGSRGREGARPAARPRSLSWPRAALSVSPGLARPHLLIRSPQAPPPPPSPPSRAGRRARVRHGPRECAWRGPGVSLLGLSFSRSVAFLTARFLSRRARDCLDSGAKMTEATVRQAAPALLGPGGGRAPRSGGSASSLAPRGDFVPVEALSRFPRIGTGRASRFLAVWAAGSRRGRARCGGARSRRGVVVRWPRAVDALRPVGWSPCDRFSRPRDARDAPRPTSWSASD